MSHVLSLALYTNFTLLCTAFSSVFRKLSNAETDEELRQRNRNFREMARLLTETVHCFGTYIQFSEIAVFYHGVNREMSFPSMFAQFCSPTSTTDSLEVAVNFAQTGIVLELARTTSFYLKYFSCLMSDFEAESEHLFIQGGYWSSASGFSDTALPFHSIRSLEFGLNYKPVVQAISCFQQLFKPGWNVQNRIELTKKHISLLQQLFSNWTTRKTESEVHRNLWRVQQQFNEWCSTVHEVGVDAKDLNFQEHGIRKKVYGYEQFRRLLCKCYSKQELAANEQQWALTEDSVYDSVGFVNPIFSLEFDLLLDLFPSLTRIEVYRVPLTRALFSDILETVCRQRSEHRIEEVHILHFKKETGYGREVDRNYYSSQNDFGSCSECCTRYQTQFGSDYQTQFEAEGWSMQVTEESCQAMFNYQVYRLRIVRNV